MMENDFAVLRDLAGRVAVCPDVGAQRVSSFHRRYSFKSQSRIDKVLTFENVTPVRRISSDREQKKGGFGGRLPARGYCGRRAPLFTFESNVSRGVGGNDAKAVCREICTSGPRAVIETTPSRVLVIVHQLMSGEEEILELPKEGARVEVRLLRSER
jgi:hypothetical protein